jgi:hypothetical protein
MADVIHDPRTDWCACEPYGPVVCDYRLLADKVVDLLDPRDDDAAEVSACMDAVERVANYVKSQPCTCTPGHDDEPCGRCAAIGQWHGEVRP